MNAPTSHARAHLGDNMPPTDRDALCLRLMTDAQALATWERMKAVRKAYVAAVLQEIAE